MSAGNLTPTTNNSGFNTGLDPKENEDTESDASDESDEITEADEDEFDRRRAECLANMKELEAKFLKLKEELINEKQILIDQKLKEIEDESAEEFVIPLQKFKENMELKIKLTSKRENQNI